MKITNIQTINGKIYTPVRLVYTNHLCKVNSLPLFCNNDKLEVGDLCITKTFGEYWLPKIYNQHHFDMNINDPFTKKVIVNTNDLGKELFDKIQNKELAENVTYYLECEEIRHNGWLQCEYMKEVGCINNICTCYHFELKQPLTLVNEEKELIDTALKTFKDFGKETIKSTTNCPTCGVECKIGGDGETHYLIPKPKLEVDSWDEVVKEFIKHIQFDKVESQTIEFINWIKQHYTTLHTN
jgi:hypothetical protein